MRQEFYFWLLQIFSVILANLQHPCTPVFLAVQQKNMILNHIAPHCTGNMNALVSVKYLEGIIELKVLFQKAAKLFHNIHINLPSRFCLLFLLHFSPVVDKGSLVLTPFKWPSPAHQS